MTYNEAMYHKLMLQAGFREAFDRRLDQLLQTEDPLSPLVLELSHCGGDRNRIISCLQQYTQAAAWDPRKVFDLVWEDLRQRHHGGSIAPSLLVAAMSRISLDSGHYAEEPWQSLNSAYDYYDEACQGMYAMADMKAALDRFFTDRTPIRLDLQLQLQDPEVPAIH